MKEKINPGYEEFIKAKRGEPFDIKVIQKNSPLLNGDVKKLKRKEVKNEKDKIKNAS